MLHEQFISISAGNSFQLKIYPFSWFLGFYANVYDYGDEDKHHYRCLCFVLDFRMLNSKGMEGKRYRESLKSDK